MNQAHAIFFPDLGTFFKAINAIPAKKGCAGNIGKKDQSFIGPFKLPNTFTLGFLYPISRRLRYFYDYIRCYIDGHRCTYKYTSKGFYPRWFLDMFPIVITLGFYFFAAFLRIEESNFAFTHIKKDQEESASKAP